MRDIESGDLKIVGVNCFPQTAESPLTAGTDSGIMKVDVKAEREQIARSACLSRSPRPDR